MARFASLARACCRTQAWLLAAAALYVPMMIAAALVFGGHYFVDILAGVAVTMVLIAALRRSKRGATRMEGAPPIPAAPAEAGQAL
jgi:membrane-associated phospholipid phosphatase